MLLNFVQGVQYFFADMNIKLGKALLVQGYMTYCIINIEIQHSSFSMFFFFVANANLALSVLIFSRDATSLRPSDVRPIFKLPNRARLA